MSAKSLISRAALFLQTALEKSTNIEFNAFLDRFATSMSEQNIKKSLNIILGGGSS
jgi:hypothetical protein